MKSLRNPSVRLLLFVVLLLVIVGVVLITRPPDNRARVIFDNQSACGTIVVRLTDTESGDIKSTAVPIGQRGEIEVRPDVFYEYLVDFTSAGRTAENYRCTAVKTGKVRVPAGSAQTFVLNAATPVPTP